MLFLRRCGLSLARGRPRNYIPFVGLLFVSALAPGCATVAPTPTPIDAPLAHPIAPPPQTSTPATLKRKIAIGRFTNTTRYGRALLLPTDQDPLAQQAADMLAEQLTNSGRFTVLERGDLDAIRQEQTIGRTGGANLVGADVLIIGSVTQFGRDTEGQRGFLSSTIRQKASATVEVRLVDVRTGVAFFATRGSGNASVEAGEVAGFGSAAAYDSTLNDKAIDAAIADLINNVIQQLDAHS